MLKPFVEVILECFASDCSWNESSAWKGDASIVAKYTLTVVDILLKNVAAIFKMTSSIEVAMEIVRRRKLTLITLVTHLRDHLLHDI